MRRAIHSPAILWAVFGVIVGLQLVCACLCWFGAAQMWVARADLLQFNNAKQLALLGLGLTAAFFFVGWLAIASEWYQMWQSQKMNVLQDAFRSFCEAMLILIWVNTPG
jgi:predicted small integral membrane protein